MKTSERNYALATGVFSAAIAVLALYVYGVPPADPLYTTLLSVFALFISGKKVVVPRVQGNLSGGFLFTIFAVFQVSLPEALFVGFVSVVAQTKWNSRTQATLYRYFFNLSCVTLSVVATKVAYDYLQRSVPPQMFLLNAVICGAIYFCVNTGVLSGMLSMSQPRSFVGLWRETFFWSMPLFAIGSGLMGALCVLTTVVGRSATLLIGPILILVHRYHTMKVNTMEDSQRRLEMANAHIREMNEVHVRTIEALALAISAKDEVTGSHLNRVRIYCRNLGELMGLSETEKQALDAASLLHDIGKLAVPEHILTKPGRLTPAEFESIKQHPQIGAEILERVHFPYPVVPIVRSHHEQWAGGGYPDGLRGEAIPIGARILSAVDCFDALASDRQYRNAIPIDDVMRMIEADSGIRYDPSVVTLLKANYVKWEAEARESVSNLNLLDVAPVKISVAPAAGFSQEGCALSPSAFTAINSASLEVQMMLELSGIMVSAATVGELIQQISPRLAPVVPFDGLSLYLVGGGVAERVFAYGTEVHSAVEDREMPVVKRAIGSEELVLMQGDVAPDGSSGNTAFPSVLALPLFGSAREIVGVLLLASALPGAFSRDHIRILNTIATQLGMTLQLLRMFASVVNESRIDPLTGVGNRRDFEERISQDLSSAIQKGEPFSILCVDIDDFKSINDRYGHAIGDEVLCCVSDVFRDVCKPMDYVCRIGGDEFVLVLPGAEAALVPEYRQRIEELLSQRTDNFSEAEMQIQLSIGAASLDGAMRNRAELMAAADADMYAVKRRRKSPLPVS